MEMFVTFPTFFSLITFVLNMSQKPVIICPKAASIYSIDVRYIDEI